MRNPENRNMQRVGLLGIGTLAVLTGGSVYLSSRHEFSRLEAQRRSIATSSTVPQSENPQIRKISAGMAESLGFVAAGGVIAAGGTILTAGVAVSVIQSGKRRQEV